MRYASKIGLVLRVRLDPQTGSKDELTNGSSETGKESVERLRGKEDGKSACQFLQSGSYTKENTSRALARERGERQRKRDVRSFQQ